MTHKPTEATRGYVKDRARIGIPQENIAKAVGISAKILRKHYRDELDKAEEEANVDVASNLFHIASGRNESATVRDVITAACFWLKTRAGWRETENKQHSGEVTIKMLSGDDKL